jgi:hypothetical protein
MSGDHIGMVFVCCAPPLIGGFVRWAASLMSKTALLAISVLAGASVMLAAVESTKHSAKPPAGFVPDAKTAIKIAVAVWEPIYGEKEIAGEKPYTARLETNGIWVVEGSLHAGLLGKGGVAIAEISKDDGRILRVSHGK